MPTHLMLPSVWHKDVQGFQRCYISLKQPVTHAVQWNILNICRGLQDEVKYEIRFEKLSDDDRK